MELLGHVLEASRVSVEEEKIEAIKDSPRPNYITELTAFLGLIGYYIRFIEGFEDKSTPLHDGTSCKHRFEWTDEMSEDCKVIKEALTRPPVLFFTDFSKPFTVENCSAEGKS